jgi:hypothetical protein
MYIAIGNTLLNVWRKPKNQGLSSVHRFKHLSTSGTWTWNTRSWATKMAQRGRVILAILNDLQLTPRTHTAEPPHTHICLHMYMYVYIHIYIHICYDFDWQYIYIWTKLNGGNSYIKKDNPIFSLLLKSLFPYPVKSDHIDSSFPPPNSPRLPLQLHAFSSFHNECGASTVESYRGHTLKKGMHLPPLQFPPLWGWILLLPHLCFSLARDQSCCDFMAVMATSGPEDSSSWHCSPSPTLKNNFHI